MNAIKIMVKGWVKVLPFYLFTLLPLFASCSEADEEDEEFADWQSRNETYFEGQYQAHSSQSSSSFVLPSWGQPSTASLSDVAHTSCILVDVLPSRTTVADGGTESPFYTDSVKVHYSGRLMPTAHYPSGYVFDSSYLNSLDADVDVPYTVAVNAVVEGFSTALQHMHRGDCWRVTVPYQLGYGSTDRTSIPGYSTLVFDIELIDFWSNKEGDRD